MENNFTFEISLSILNHLGRGLYRSFTTILGEAISNSWDADAENVWIYFDKKNNNLIVKDDGIGMSKEDFQDKFLKIGYSKRNEGNISKKRKRPYIGRKGIGKLALLSCAKRVHIISRDNKSKEYSGGIIDNSDLNSAITKDLTPEKYSLEKLDIKIFNQYLKDFKTGTIFVFENISRGTKKSLDYLRKIIALYFKFSLIDESFKIYFEGEEISYNDFTDLAEKTEFLWNINNLKDPYIEKILKNLKEKKVIKFEEYKKIKGFIVSVEKPNDLRIFTMGERLGIDLFVNGRLRERDILERRPTNRHVECYLYGQIHFNELDDSIDRFISSRESIFADDNKYNNFLDSFREKIIKIILEDWDKWRRKNRKDGNPEDLSISLKERKAEELANVVFEEFIPPKNSEIKNKVNNWCLDLHGDAKFNFQSYAECFVSENLIRKYICEENISLTKEGEKKIKERAGETRRGENRFKRQANMNINLRRNEDDLSYLFMSDLVDVVDKPKSSKKEDKINCLKTDAGEYRPIRNAIMHTALLTDEAKRKLTTIYDNIKERIKILINNKEK